MYAMHEALKKLGGREGTRQRVTSTFSMRGWSGHGLQVYVDVVLLGLSLPVDSQRPLARLPPFGGILFSLAFRALRGEAWWERSPIIAGRRGEP